MKILGEEINEYEIVNITSPEGRLIMKKIPKGYELVQPDNKLLKGDLIAFGYSTDAIMLSSVDTDIVGYWKSTKDKNSYIKEGDVYRDVVVSSDLWRVIRKKSEVSSNVGSKHDKQTTQLEKEMMFFFGCKPSDPSRLPPPPRVIGMTWDDYVD